MVATTLSAGDIAIIGFNFDNPDEFAFTPLVDIGAGTEINFTDNGWQAAGSFRATEGTFTWTAPTDITAGTIINPTVSSILFSASGDQIIAYQGADTNPTFIYALNSEGNPGVWQSDSTSSNTSALPTGLVNGETAVALDEIDNAIYTGITSGTQAEILAAIGDNSNWSGSNSTRQTMPTDPFTVGDSSSSLVINEVLGSTTGTDVEFIELFGQAGTSLDGLSVIVVESDAGSSNGTIDKQVDLGAEDVIGDNGFFLIGNTQILESSVYGVTPNQEIESNFIENSSYTIALAETSSLTGNNISGSEIVVDTVGVSDGGATDSFFFDAPVLGPDGSFLPAGVRRVADGVDTDTTADWVFGDFFLGSDNTPTAGTDDDGGGGEEPTLKPIYEIQGSGTVSPIVGETVVTEGIVTGDFQDGDADTSRNLRGFYIQDETGDSDLTTSDGVFVFESSLIADVNVGDKVRITGTVNEFFGETQITASEVEIIGSGLVTPTNIDLPTVSTVVNADGELIADLEQYEGMLASFPETLTVTELFNLDRFGELRVSEGGRLQQFTQINDPSVSGFQAHLEDIASRTITIDDGLTIQNPDPIIYPAPELDSNNTLRMGDTVTNLTGNVRFSRGSGGSGDETYRILPTEAPNFVNENIRPETPEDVGGSLKVASLNVLNYFTTLDEPGNTSGPNNLNPRGADNQTEFERQQQKIVTAITDIDADILGLVEIENTDINSNGEDVALSNLVEAINTELGSEVYDYISTGFIGGDAIKVGMIYKPTEVQPVGDFAILDSSVDPTFVDDRNRPALAQTFAEVGTAEELTIAVNHFKSKGSSGLSDPNDPNFAQGDGQGFWNAVRTDAANALTSWLATDPTNSGDPDFLIVGDLNAYAQEDPIVAIESAGYTNLVEQFVGADAYSFVFDGQAGTLDYALANSSLTTQVTGVTEWQVNADEPDALDYNLDFGRNPSVFNGEDPFRNSDHDPIIIGLELESSTPGEIIDGTRRRDNLTGTDSDDTITGFRNRDTLTGGGGQDTFVYTSIVDAGDIITDFEVDVDKIDLVGVLNSVSFAGADPIADGYVGFTSSGVDTILTIDADGTTGSGSPRSFLLAQGVDAVELNNSDNFIFS